MKEDIRANDLDALNRALAKTDLNEETRAAFDDMLSSLEKYPKLTDKQRQWVLRVLGEEPIEYENLVSSDKAPRGKEVPTPPALQNLPKRPPQKRSEE